MTETLYDAVPDPSPVNAKSSTANRKDRRWAQSIGLLTLLATMVPYLVGSSLSDGRRYMWLGYNLDDSCVYLAWMRQAADGSLRALNLFTTQPQHGMALNPLFLLMGLCSRVFGLPLIAVYHIARIGFGCALLWIAWTLIVTTVRDRLARRLSFLFVCVSAGFGWLPLWWVDGPYAVAIDHTPVDAWQPEAITFLSLYLSPLFCASLVLQAAIILLLHRGDKTQRIEYALCAGFCGLTLSLIHTYDIISLALLWLSYLGVHSWRLSRTAQTARLRVVWIHTAIAAVITAPGVAYIAYELHTETVFRQRADVATLSPSPAYIFLGYGLCALLALCAVYASARRTTRESQDATQDGVALWMDTESRSLIYCWAVANFAAAYLPTAFQRKLLQGEHLPVSLLAGVGAVWILSSKRLGAPLALRPLAGYMLAAVTCLTNVRFLLREMTNTHNDIAQTGSHRPYLQPGEVEALSWIDAHVPRTVAIQPLPRVAALTDEAGHTKIAPSDVSLACFAPGMTGRHVYCGHWGETPDYRSKLGELVRFALPSTTDEARVETLQKMRVGYLIYAQKDDHDDAADRLAPMFRGLLAPPPYLVLVHSNNDADVYRVDTAALRP